MPRPKQPVTGFNLNDDSRRVFASIFDAARHVAGDDKDGIRAVYSLVDKRPHRSGWIFVHREREEELRSLVEGFRDQWKAGKVRFHRRRERHEPKKPALVALRIDSKTVILVKPEKATAETAARWRERYQHDQNNTDRNDGMNIYKKGGRYQ